MGIDRVHELYRILQAIKFKNFIDRTGYNRRKRGLLNFIKEIRVILSLKFNQYEEKK